VLSNTRIIDIEVIPGAVNPGTVSANSVDASETVRVARVFEVAFDDVMDLQSMILFVPGDVSDLCLKLLQYGLVRVDLFENFLQLYPFDIYQRNVHCL